MTRILCAVTAIILALPAAPAAHRLDEYLQATRVALDRDRITLEIDLTPGARIASAVFAVVDRDGDRAISPLEAGEYGQRVLSDLELRLDGRLVMLRLTRAETPPLDEMLDGLGTIHLQAVGTVPPVSAGRRQVYVRNTHEPAASIYLANALLPADRKVVVLRQDRDFRQQEIRIEYDVAPGWLGELGWLTLGTTGLLAWVTGRRRHPKAGGPGAAIVEVRLYEKTF